MNRRQMKTQMTVNTNTKGGRKITRRRMHTIKNEEDNKDPDDGIEINKQARQIAEDRQSDINKAKK
eukprot:315018-Heterocapsa_arctica.AAC.1